MCLISALGGQYTDHAKTPSVFNKIGQFRINYIEYFLISIHRYISEYFKVELRCRY
jgi:hypothetical protein